MLQDREKQVGNLWVILLVWHWQKIQLLPCRGRTSGRWRTPRCGSLTSAAPPSTGSTTARWWARDTTGMAPFTGKYFHVYFFLTVSGLLRWSWSWAGASPATSGVLAASPSSCTSGSRCSRPTTTGSTSPWWRRSSAPSPSRKYHSWCQKPAILGTITVLWHHEELHWYCCYCLITTSVWK